MVMKKLEINATGLVIEFLNRYQVWKDYNTLHHPSLEKIVDIRNSKTGIPCIQYSDVDAVNRCDAPIIVIDCIEEGKHAAVWFNQYNKDKHYIIFASDGHCNQLPPSAAANILINYTWITYYHFLFKVTDTSNNPLGICFYQENEYQFNTPKPMRFVSTTGVARVQRDYVKDQLLKKINYTNFIFKYSGVDLGMPSGQFDIVKFEPDSFDPYTSLLKKYPYSLSDTLPINMYNQANFNLVVETDIPQRFGFFPTEKTIKCLITGMPFVIVATPHFLKYLKEIGFHTYDSLWDESYDADLEYINRVDKIVDLCNNLDSFDWTANQSALELIALKNRSNFLNLNRTMNKNFQQFEQAILGLNIT